MEHRVTRFGLHNTLTAKPGQRDALAAILLEGSKAAASRGCKVYIVSHDEKNADVIHVTEFWTSEADHDAYLAEPGVKAMVERGRPMVAAMPQQVRLAPIGGTGIG
jgi:quinol monooxygenase YgiN